MAHYDLELRDAEELSLIASPGSAGARSGAEGGAESIDQLSRRAVMAIAAFVGTTRLIDNRVLAAPSK